MTRHDLDLWACTEEIFSAMATYGVLCTVVDEAGQDNVLTLGWGQIGRSYHSNPILTIAITPLRYSWRFLDQVPEFVIAVPDEATGDAAELCGTRSGRDMDKFDAAGLTRVKSRHVRAPSVPECPINIECRVYHRVAPPHLLLTPEHREAPLENQHTIYFAEVLGTYRYSEP